ncbi:Protein of unknown function [Bacillus cereus]|nr:Protein of unknown function [Bacillus cereus]
MSEYSFGNYMKY